MRSDLKIGKVNCGSGSVVSLAVVALKIQNTPFTESYSGCVIEDNMNYHGPDLYTRTVESQQACADFCASTVGGFFWVWNNVGNKVCYVKGPDSVRVGNEYSVAGNRNCGRGKRLQR